VFLKNINREETMIIVTKQGDIKEYGKPVKETEFKLVFQLGVVNKHSINKYHKEQTLKNFRLKISEIAFDNLKVGFSSFKYH
tara:strand:+ start:6877 stop:7122 length:246 start_codon:yes stop_codon:yes gene_type:complete